MDRYDPPPLNCPHGRQTTFCAICAPEADANYAAWKGRQTEGKGGKAYEVRLDQEPKGG